MTPEATILLRCLPKGVAIDKPEQILDYNQKEFQTTILHCLLHDNSQRKMNCFLEYILEIVGNLH